MHESKNGFHNPMLVFNDLSNNTTHDNITKKKKITPTLRVGEVPLIFYFFKILFYDFVGVSYLYTRAKLQLSSTYSFWARAGTDRRTDMAKL